MTAAQSRSDLVLKWIGRAQAPTDGIPMWIIGTYPEFWSRWSNLFFWPLIGQFVFFLMEVFFLFFGYYLTWDILMKRKRLHLFFGVAAAFWGVLVQFVWDAVGGYMLTPSAALPGVDQPVAWSAAAFFNPSLPFLFAHRFVGNISYAMLLVGGVFALRYMATKYPEEKVYFGWACNLTFTVGFLAFFGMPVIGWGYAKTIQRHAPAAFQAIMGGFCAPHFIVKMVLVGTMVVIAGVYVVIRYRQKSLLWATTAGLAIVYLFVWLHPPLAWLPGGALVWRLASTIALFGFAALLWCVRERGNPDLKRWQWGMFVAGLCAFFAFCVGGFVREHCKSPWTVYKVIAKPEATEAESARFEQMEARAERYRE